MIGHARIDADCHLAIEAARLAYASRGDQLSNPLERKDCKVSTARRIEDADTSWLFMQMRCLSPTKVTGMQSAQLWGNLADHKTREPLLLARRLNCGEILAVGSKILVGNR